MAFSFGLALFVFVSIPAFIQLYVFQYFSRIRRPLETNPIGSVSVIVISATILHITCAINIYAFSSGNLTEFLDYIGDFALPKENRVNSYSNATEFLQDGIQYFIVASIFGSVFGAGLARLSIYNWRPFDLIGRLYYGGLFGAYKGFASYDVRVSVLSSVKIDSKSVIYSGTLEELKLKDSGQIDYLTLSGPESRIIENDIVSSKLVTTTPKLIGENDFDDFLEIDDALIVGYTELDESEFDYLNDVDEFLEQNRLMISQYQNSFENRMIIEGEDIANIYLSRDTKKHVGKQNPIMHKRQR